MRALGAEGADVSAPVTSAMVRAPQVVTVSTPLKEAMAHLSGGIDVAFLAYTYGTEGRMPPAERWWRVATIDQDRFAIDLAEARRAGADLVVVGLHWGREYQNRPDPAQESLARRLVDLGADVVWGTHPHALQPAEVLTVDDPLRGRRDALILYSLGNFVSNQRTPNQAGGVIVRFTAAVCEQSDQAWLTSVRFLPTWVDDRSDAGRSKFRALPIAESVAMCRGEDLSADDCSAMAAFRAHAAQILPEAQFDPTLGLPHGAAIVEVGMRPRWFRYVSP
jgi:hypothetical protein